MMTGTEYLKPPLGNVRNGLPFTEDVRFVLARLPWKSLETKSVIGDGEPSRRNLTFYRTSS